MTTLCTTKISTVMFAFIAMTLAGCNMPSVIETASNAQAIGEGPVCDSVFDRSKSRDYLKNLIVRTVTDHRDSYANQPDFFRKNLVILGFAELRSDKRDLVVYLSGSGYCGTGGCKGYIFQNITNDGDELRYRLIARIRPARLPIVSLDSTRNGWNDIGVAVAGGGITTPYIGLLPFDGANYDSNPTAFGVPQVSENKIKSAIISDPGIDTGQCRLI
jgi:hypothetical protein